LGWRTVMLVSLIFPHPYGIADGSPTQVYTMSGFAARPIGAGRL